MSTTILKASECARSGDLPFFLSLSDGDWSRIITAKDEDARSLLHSAAANGHADLVNLLLDKVWSGQLAGGGAAVNDSDEDGWTPLISAASSGKADIVSLLLKAGASAKAANSGKRTALHYAASKGHERVIALLLDAGADVNACDVTGATPLHRACAALKQDAALALMRANAKLAIADKQGNTPLHVAVELAVDCRSAQIAFILAARGAPLDVRNADGVTPLDHAGPNAEALKDAALKGMPFGDDDMQECE